MTSLASLSLETQTTSPADLFIKLPTDELKLLTAADSDLYGRVFFPQAVRNETPEFHRDIWRLLESNHRKINLQIFRGGAKTTLCRIYASKRIAYGLAKTVLILGKSEGHAIRTGTWLKNKIERQDNWAQTFQLRKGSKWQDVEFEIINEYTGQVIWVMCMGMTGSVRGVNRDDYRPDLIILDDPIDEENSGTAEQREKVNALIYGAIVQSLAPATDTPDAKLVMLQTPLNKEDASVMALSDDSWRSAKFPCWTPETAFLPPSQQMSAWEAVKPTKDLRQEKQQYQRRNQLSLWYREMEVRITAPELNAFRPEWLRRYNVPPEQGRRIMVIDPVPPPSEAAVQKGKVETDYEVLHVMQQSGKDLFSLEYQLNRGHAPDWTIKTFFEMVTRWRPEFVLVETIAYQSMLQWLLKKSMEQMRIWVPVLSFGRDDRRNKYAKIVQGLNGLGAAGHLYCKDHQLDLISQFNDYPHVTHDDVLETFAIGATHLANIGGDVYTGLPEADLPVRDSFGERQGGFHYGAP